MEAAWWAHSLPGLCSFSLSFSFLFRLTRAISSSFSFCSPAGLSPSLPRRSPRHPSLLSPSVVPPNRYLLFLSSSNAFHLVAPCPASSVLFSVPVSPSLSLKPPLGLSFSLATRGARFYPRCVLCEPSSSYSLSLSLCLFLRLSSSLFPYDCIFNLGRLSFLDLGLASPRYYFFLFLSPLGVSPSSSLPFSNLSSLYFLVSHGNFVPDRFPGSPSHI